MLSPQLIAADLMAANRVLAAVRKLFNCSRPEMRPPDRAQI
jgi:hypothetical protein